GDIARYWPHVNAAISIVTCAFAAPERSEIANAVLINRSFILLILLDAAELVSSGRKTETGSDRFGAVLLRIHMHFGLRLWRVLRAAYALHAPSCASDCDAPSFYHLPVA
ncbi:MAG: hypothetical protein WBD15_21225, partial [Pseudolabrys sp.]